jgi:hypothetical protein
MGKQLLMRPTTRFWQLSPVLQVTFITTILLNILVYPSFAGDPFRSREPHKIGDRTEAAFKAIFQQGNYPLAKDSLQ